MYNITSFNDNTDADVLFLAKTWFRKQKGYQPDNLMSTSHPHC